MQKALHHAPMIRFFKSGALAAAILCVFGHGQTQNAIANGDTRSLTVYHQHTHESATITFRRDGSYDREGLRQLNWILRDWRVEQAANMDPSLFDLVWAVHRESGSRAPIKIMSAYRSPTTNAMLRRRSRAVAKESQHMNGKAMDVHFPDVSMGRVRELAVRLQHGGVGYYPRAGSPFVHMDVGSVRAWPRLDRSALSRLFPDGKTVHIPRDGTPLPGYQLAMAEIRERGGRVVDYAELGRGKGKSFWERLFGGGEEEEEEVAAPRAPTKKGPATIMKRQPTQVASADASPPASSEPEGPLAFLLKQQTPTAPEPVAASPAVASLQQAKPAIPAPLAPKPAADDDDDEKPAGKDAKDAPKDGEKTLQTASVPLPPWRPRDLKAPDAVALNMPLPPSRPLELATATVTPTAQPAKAEEAKNEAKEADKNKPAPATNLASVNATPATTTTQAAPVPTQQQGKLVTGIPLPPTISRAKPAATTEYATVKPIPNTAAAPAATPTAKATSETAKDTAKSGEATASAPAANPAAAPAFGLQKIDQQNNQTTSFSNAARPVLRNAIGNGAER